MSALRKAKFTGIEPSIAADHRFSKTQFPYSSIASMLAKLLPEVRRKRPPDTMNVSRGALR
jgi:hypothetical protein